MERVSAGDKIGKLHVGAGSPRPAMLSRSEGEAPLQKIYTLLMIIYYYGYRA